AADLPERLLELVRDADEAQFLILYPKLSPHAHRVQAAMSQTLAADLDAQKSDKDKEALAKRQANAAIVLLKAGRDESVWRLFRPRADPRVRSYLLQRLGPLGVDAALLGKRLEQEQDTSSRRALLLALGDYGPDHLPAAERARLLPQILRIYA